MRCVLISLMSAMLVGAAPPLAPGDGYWTNEEDRYFTAEAGGPNVPWTGIEVAAGRWRTVDAYRAPQSDWAPLPVPGLARGPDGRWLLTPGSGPATELRHGAPFTCWMAITRYAKKADGSEDWLFVRDLALHDQGGRVVAGGASSGAPVAILRLRQVVWPAPSTNRPVLALYVHRPDAPDRAVAYAWSDPDSQSIGINLRWMQGRCARPAAPAGG